MTRLHHKCNKKYLLLPIVVQQPLKDIYIYADGELIYEFRIPVSDEQEYYSFHYYASVTLENCAGKEIMIEGEVGDAFLEAVGFSDAILRKADSHPAVHFSANTGWINDPNGFFYQAGIYHLYFQHNPFDISWNNMSWGHAVSTDLIHWEQMDNVLYPDEDGVIFSGCTLVDEKDRLTFFYTSAGNHSHWSKGKKFTQKLAYSADGGMSIIKTGVTAVPHIAGENRDPKVYWHEESQGYYMVLYLEKNEFAILRSDNLVDWKQTQQLTLEAAWECPDLFKLPVESGGSKWVFWCADGFYFLGDFDGFTFIQTSGKMQAYATALPYAAQTCWGGDKVISVPWIRSCNSGHTYTGVMGIPRELSLAERNGVLKLRQRPAAGLAACREEIEKTAGEGEILYKAEAVSAIELIIEPDKKKDFSVSAGRTEITYDSRSRKMEVSGCVIQKEEKNWRKAEKTQVWGGCGKKEIILDRDLEQISILIDHEILEITVDDGMEYAVFEIQTDTKQVWVDVSVKAQGNIKLYQIV